MSVRWDALIPVIAHDAAALVRKGLTNAQFLQQMPDVAGIPAAARGLSAIVESQLALNSFLRRLAVLGDAESIARPGRPSQNVQLVTLVLGAKLECQEAIREAEAELSTAELPACSVHSGIQTVLRELIDNSIRYRHADRPLRIEIEAERADQTVQVRVRDNGAGISPRFADRLFEPLRRHETRSGFGLGLAISKEIVTALGGNIRVEPAGSGTSAVFEVPCAG
jgi:signal transduction histidine kinase